MKAAAGGGGGGHGGEVASIACARVHAKVVQAGQAAWPSSLPAAGWLDPLSDSGSHYQLPKKAHGLFRRVALASAMMTTILEKTPSHL